MNSGIHSSQRPPYTCSLVFTPQASFYVTRRSFSRMEEVEFTHNALIEPLQLLNINKIINKIKKQVNLIFHHFFTDVGVDFIPLDSIYEKSL